MAVISDSPLYLMSSSLKGNKKEEEGLETVVYLQPTLCKVNTQRSEFGNLKKKKKNSLISTVLRKESI